MDSNVLSVITELDQYIAMGKSRLETILKALDWTIEDSLKERSSCSTSKSRERESLHKNDPLLPESFGCKNSVVIDKHQLQVILQKANVSIPERFSDIQLNFKREQKAALYDYVIANTTKTSEPELKVSFTNDDTDNTMTFAEIVAKAKKKDKKLQRKYRTSKPTHIEEVRNLVHLQMQALKKYFNPEFESKSSICKDKEIDSRRSRCRDNFEGVGQKSKSRDKTIQNNLSESRCRSRSRTPSRKKSTRTDMMRSRSTDESNRLLNRKSPSVDRKKHKSDKRSRIKDKTKQKHKKSKSLKSKKKHKHHRKHSSPK